MLEDKKTVLEETSEVTIQNSEVNLEREEENPGIGYEIVIGSAEA